MTGFRRAVALAAAALLALLLPVAVAPSSAHACSCAASPVGAQARSADVPFVGVVREVDDDGDEVTYAVDVERTWSDDLATPVEVTSGGQDGACGIGGLDPGDRWLMLAAGSDGELSIGLCDGSAPAGRRVLEKVEAALGPGSTAVPAARDDDGVTYGGLGPTGEGWLAWVVGGACCLGAAALVVALVVALLRRGRRGG